MTKNKIKKWLSDSAKTLSSQSEFPFLETQIILAFTLNKSREWLITHLDDELDEQTENQANIGISRLINGEPLPYITGKQAFFGLDFMVSPDVLIPRPETEQLVEECIEWLEKNPQKRNILDIGTGSGIISISLADHFSDLQITAVDISQPALEVARRNAERIQVLDRINFIQSDLFSSVSGKYDAIVANLPYIPTNVLMTLPVLKFEPRLALDGGDDGMVLISRLIHQCETFINPGGMVLLEIESSLSDSVLDLAASQLPKATITLLNDLANLPRIIKIQV